MSRKRRERIAFAEHAPRPFPWPWAAFAAALLIRFLYWRATSDSSWPHSAAFKGDAILWVEYARALRTGAPFELGLPIHPPGTAYLVAALGSGGGSFTFLKAVWCVLGASAAGLFTAAIVRAFGVAVGAVAGVVMAASSGLLMLSASLNGETPYLALVALGFWMLPAPDTPSRVRLASWAAVQGIACLFRVEHVLFFALALAFVAARSLRAIGAARTVAASAMALAAFAAPLLPWHWSAWRAIERFNEGPAAPPPALRAFLGQLSGISWEPEARARLAALPAFARNHGEAFVAATVAHRGGARVRVEDFEILREAFGSEPRPLAPRPFVSLYGPLNFALASHPGCGPGFGHAALDDPPPLAGGATSYPPMLVAGLPPRELAFTYPPHLALINDGHAMGWRWLAAEPARAARRAAARLARFWAGAATALTGYGLPAGLSGIRYAVDVTVADGILAAAWRIALLAAAAAGLIAGRRNPALHPWLLLLATKAIAAAAFFGYARLGATTIPVVALLVAIAAVRWWPARARHVIERAARVALLALIVVEAGRWLDHPRLLLGGHPAGPHDPVARFDQEDQRLEID